MKKMFFVISAIILMSMMVLPEGINVTSPVGSSVWDVGKPYSISWNGSCVGSNVKINIFKNSINQANFVTQLTSSSGNTKNWAIPNSFTPGKYVIRIKDASNNNCFGDSAVFEIKGLQVVTAIMIPKENVIIQNNIPQNIPLLQLPDFHVYDVKVSKDNYLLVMYENLGAFYNGPLEMGYKIKNIETVVSRNVVIGKNTRSFFLTGRLLTKADLSDNGKSVGVWATVDPGKKVLELKDTNNQMYGTVYPDLGIPDYHPTDMTFEVVKISTQPRHLPQGHLKVKVKNLGSSYNGMVKVRILYKWLDEPGYEHSFPDEILNLDLNGNQEKWLTLQLMWWPVRDTTSKEPNWFKVIIEPAPGNPEIITDNNFILKFWEPGGPF